jgi:hypothetical protein
MKSLHIARRQKNISNAADRTGSSYALTFTAGDIRGKQEGRQSLQPAPCLPSEPFCHAFNEVSPKPGVNPPGKKRAQIAVAI